MEWEDGMDADTFFAMQRFENLMVMFEAATSPEAVIPPTNGLIYEIYKTCRQHGIAIPPAVLEKLFCILDDHARRHREDHPAGFTHPADYSPGFLLVDKLVYWGCTRKSKPPGNWQDYFQGIPVDALEDFFANKPSQNKAIDLVTKHRDKPDEFRRYYFKWKARRK